MPGSVWAAYLGTTLAQTAREEKLNEITAISQVLQLARLQGAIATIDAMLTQAEIA